MLNITGETAKRYRIEFRKEKSKVLKIGKDKNETPSKLKLGSMELDNTSTYTYFGETTTHEALDTG